MRFRKREFTNKRSRTQITEPVFPPISLFLVSCRSIEAICVSIGHQKILTFFCFEYCFSLCASPSSPVSQFPTVIHVISAYPLIIKATENFRIKKKHCIFTKTIKTQCLKFETRGYMLAAPP